MSDPAKTRESIDAYCSSGTSPTESPAQAAQQTLAVQAGICSDPTHGAVVPPLYLSTNFTFAGFDQKRPYDYSRSGNPTRDELGQAIANLEGGHGGIVTSSGMSAISVVLQLLRPGDRLVAPHDCYGGTYRLISSLANKGHFTVEFVDMNDQQALSVAIAGRPKLVWIETPSNPLLRITDIRRVASQAHAVDALVAVDNTFLSPILQQPLSLGADLVVHSTTKYLNGHSDIVGGAIIAKHAKLHDQIAWWANCLGVTGAPFDSYLTLRGLRTLSCRLAVHQQNTRAIAALLDGHPAVDRVYFPGRADHPGHAIATKQQRGFGAMLSLDLRGGQAAVERFVDGLSCFALAESLGGVESLVAHPATMTHAAMDPAARRRAGISDGLLRLSVGIEATEDLLRDIKAALDRARQSGRLVKRQAA